jgi:hypothetical protein
MARSGEIDSTMEQPRPLNAARLGVNRTTLLGRMKKYGIYAKQYAYPQRAS